MLEVEKRGKQNESVSACTMYNKFYHFDNDNKWYF